QELVNNIIKHSQAQNAEIIFSRHSNGLQIEVSDDGIGYNEMKKPEEQGLYSITQRLKSIGGNFKITKNNYGGTQAMVELTV
ncbi:MAG: sensor histidine kinase, partial [Niabella sp.]